MANRPPAQGGAGDQAGIGEWLMGFVRSVVLVSSSAVRWSSALKTAGRRDYKNCQSHYHSPLDFDQDGPFTIAQGDPGNGVPEGAVGAERTVSAGQDMGRGGVVGGSAGLAAVVA